MPQPVSSVLMWLITCEHDSNAFTPLNARVFSGLSVTDAMQPKT